MNPVPNSQRENHALPGQNSWNGVNVPDSLRPRGVLSVAEMSRLDREVTPQGKATSVKLWYGVYEQPLTAPQFIHL